MNNLVLAKAFKDYSKFLNELIIKTNSNRKERGLILLRKDVNHLACTLERKSTT